MTTNDISNVLGEWPYEPGKLNVRIIKADDGRELVQLRMEMGLVQMELKGRPDGIHHEGFASLLEMYETNGVSEGLCPETCRRLREEGVQRSHRAAALYSINRWEDVIHDCTRNLDLFDLCKKYANEEQDKEALEQFRAPVIALRTQAAAGWAMSLENTIEAMAAIDQGIDSLKEVLGEYCEESNEMQLLLGMKEALVPRLPTSERADLQERLASAIHNENYELAAILRDEMRQLRE